VKVTVDAGDEVRPVTSWWDRVGYVLARAATPEAAEAAAITAAGLIKVTTESARAVAAPTAAGAA
jgi:hypothetical protein